MVSYSNTTGGEAFDHFPKNRLSEKVDIYSLGNTLYVLLTGIEPRGKEHKTKRLKQVSKDVALGKRPTFPAEYLNSTHPAIEAIRRAITLCWEPDPSLRPTAKEISEGLSAALDDLEKRYRQ